MALRRIQWLPKLAVMAAMGLPLTMLPAATAQQQQQDQQNSDRSRDQQDRDRDMNREDGQNQNRDRSQDNGQSNNDQANRNRDNQNAGLGVGIADGQRGLRVVRVANDSPAERAGIREGDEILSISGQQMNSPQQLVDHVRRQSPGDQVDITIWRNGQQQTVNASLESLREALNRNRQSQRFGEGQGEMTEERYYRGGPPWGGDDLLSHINHLEQQARMLDREIQELRSIIEDDPSRQQYRQTSNRSSNSQDQYSGSRSDAYRGDRGGERMDNDRNARWSDDNNPEERIRSRREVRSGYEDQ